MKAQGSGKCVLELPAERVKLKRLLNNTAVSASHVSLLASVRGDQLIPLLSLRELSAHFNQHRDASVSGVNLFRSVYWKGGKTGEKPTN